VFEQASRILGLGMGEGGGGELVKTQRAACNLPVTEPAVIAGDYYVCITAIAERNYFWNQYS